MRSACLAGWSWRALRALIAGAAILLIAASGAQGAVAFKQSTTGSATTPGAATNGLALAIPRPSSLAIDDVMIASAQWVLKASNGSTVGAAPPAGWTELGDNNQVGWAVELWWKRATAADVAATNFTFTASWTNRQGIAAGVISAFSGAARTGSPLSWGPVRRTGFGGYPNYAGATIANEGFGFATPGDTSYSAPSYAPVPGSLGVVAAMVTGSGNTSPVTLDATANGQATAQSASGGGGTDGINTAIGYRAPNAAGVYPDPYLQMTFSRAVDRTAFSLVLQPTPCGAGGLSLSTPAATTFPTTALTGTNLQLATTATLTVDDQSESGTTSAGWKVSLSPTQFTAGAQQLPSTALSATAASHTDGGGRCAAPTNPITYSPLSIPAGTSTDVFSASPNTGRGASVLTLNLRLSVPANARVGSYSSSWTYTLSTGP